MSYARGTEHYNLPQTVGTDKRDWFDTNKPFEDIDTDLYSAKQTADSAASDITSLTTRVGTAEGDISALTTRVGTAEGNISALQGSVTGLGNDLADVKADLRDAICSVVEPDATADYAHEVDSYFWYNDTLYITTVAIAVGATIVPNTNCNTTNVTTEIIKALTQGGSEIDDSTTALNKTWSSRKISDEIGDLSQLQTTDKSNVVSAVNEVNLALNKGSVSVTADGVKTLKQLLDELYTLVDLSKVTNSSKIVAEYTGGTLVYHLMKKQGTDLFYLHDMSTSNFDIVNLRIATNSGSGTYTVSGTSPTFGNIDSYVWSSGTKYELFY